MASRNVLAGVGGLTTGLFKGLSLGIGLRQHQQALDQRKAESEFQAYANILHASPAKRPALFDLYIQSKGGDPSNAQFKPFKNLLSKIEDEEIGAFESALKGMLEDDPVNFTRNLFKLGSNPAQLFEFLGQQGKAARRRAILEGEGQPGEPAPEPQKDPLPEPSQALPGLSTKGQINRLLLQRTLLQREGLMDDARLVQQDINRLQQQLEKEQGMSPKQFEQQLQLSRERGAAAVAQQPVPTETAKQLSELEATLEQVENVEKLYKPEFVGPIKGRVAGLKEATTGQIPEEQIEMRAALRDAADFLLRARSGAQINEQEFRRMMTFLPQDNLPPKVFEVRLSRFKRELQTLIRTKKRLAGTSRGEVVGQPTKSGVDYIYDPKTGTLKKVGE